jgi:predicted transcriptional regulator
MSQDSVLKYLKKQKEWKSTKEISIDLGNSNSCTIHSLNILFKYNEVRKKDRYDQGRRYCLWKIK